MHGTIYQVQKDPDVKNNLIGESSFYDPEEKRSNFIGNDCDYLDDITDSHDGDELDFIESKALGAIVEVTSENRSFKIGDKKPYMDREYIACAEQLEKLNKIFTRDSFESEAWIALPSELFRLKKKISGSTNDLYFIITDPDIPGHFPDPMKLTDFLRYAKTGETWYVGSIFDFHY